jgi:hypothetical protein
MSKGRKVVVVVSCEEAGRGCRRDWNLAALSRSAGPRLKTGVRRSSQRATGRGSPPTHFLRNLEARPEVCASSHFSDFTLLQAISRRIAISMLARLVHLALVYC